MAVDPVNWLAEILARIGWSQSGRNPEEGWQLAQTPGNWEYGVVYNNLIPWVRQNVTFFPEFHAAEARSAPEPDMIHTLTTINSSDHPLEFSPTGDITITDSVVLSITEGASVSVGVAADVSIPFVGGGTVSLDVSATLEQGRTEERTISHKVGWGNTVTISPHSRGTFTMAISRREVDTSFTATVTPILKQGVNSVAYSDNFQNTHNVFDFNALTLEQRVLTYSGKLQADMSVDTKITYTETRS
jgi:hypothetical protein